ncbi:amidohydrolase family protein [Magnetospira sp. QH-2]|uniref:amidohydrolase family protein n=1 Tax=Magnetospira sp. (strain QH-2) TaxID=1288970 RepID=UPI0003E81794|nr:amidohydrolase family protein [Magnetospira sp. QH-2]CCQ74515.1 2-pyrone-4,6-dicarboxylic acid hydrolase [Magnetospira sp. QH-2]
MTKDMTMDADWLPFHPHPTKPSFLPPLGAVDAHCHVFGPAARFPFAPERKYTPCDASKDQLFALRDFLGFERNVIVQATCHGKDNRALVDALIASNGLARGIATVGPDVTDAELAAMNEAGVRGVRFNFVKRLVDATPPEVFLGIAERIKDLGWHVVVYFEAADLRELIPFLKRIPNTIVVDHMGRPDVALGENHPEFRLFLQLMEDLETLWCKVTCPERLSLQGPPAYADVIPFARAVVDRFPDRVLWGTDWPHPNMKSHMPDDGHLVDIIPHIATDEAKRKALLVDNPTRLYWT